MTALTARPLSFMKVFGSTSRTSRSLTTARSAVVFHFFNFTAQRRASSSTTSNPTFCRVPAYSVPGFPNPTIAFNRLFLLLVLLLVVLLLVLLVGAFLFLLAL